MSNSNSNNDWSRHSELDDILDMQDIDTPTEIILWNDDEDEDDNSDDDYDDSSDIEDNDLDMDLPPAFLIYDHIIKKRAQEEEQQKAKRRGQQQQHSLTLREFVQNPDEIILEDNYGITWYRFWVITGLCVCLLLCFFGILMGILVGVNGKCFLRAEGCHSKELSYQSHQQQQHEHEHVDLEGNPHNIPIPKHGVDYLFRVCSKDALTTGTQQEEEEEEMDHQARTECEQECSAATCCWQGGQTCHGEVECRVYDPCENLLWHLPKEDEIQQQEEEVSPESSSSEVVSSSLFTLTQIQDACLNHQGMELCQQMCQPGACCWDPTATTSTTTTTSSTQQNNNDCSKMKCENYQPCHVLLLHTNTNEEQVTTTSSNNNSEAALVQQACKPNSNDLSDCLAICGKASCCFTTNPKHICGAIAHPESQDYILCSIYQPCDILYHPENYH